MRTRLTSANPTAPSWIDRLFRLPVDLELAGNDQRLPFAPPDPDAVVAPGDRQRVAVIDGAIDDPSLDVLAGLVGPGLAVHSGAATPGDIVVTRASEAVAIDHLHAVGDTVVVTVLDRQWGHDPDAVAAALDAGADACLEGPGMPEVAAHLRAVARRHRALRLHPAGSGLPARRHLHAVA